MPGTERAFSHLEDLLNLFPSSGSPDDRPDDPEYQILRRRIVNVLKTFSWFLSTQRALHLKFAGGIRDVFYHLSEQRKQLDLMSPQLKRAIVEYRDAYQETGQRSANYPPELDQWIQELRCDLGIQNRVCMSMT